MPPCAGAEPSRHERFARSACFALGLVFTLGGVNYDILRKQRIVDDGARVLLPIRPTDPRSLLQGDYMTLRYARTALPPDALSELLPRRGIAIVKLDGDGVAEFARLDDGAALAAGELRLRYKRRLYEHEVSYGANFFFFQEGDDDLYAQAKYGVLRVDADGDSISSRSCRRDHNMLKSTHRRAARFVPVIPTCHMQFHLAGGDISVSVVGLRSLGGSGAGLVGTTHTPISDRRARRGATLQQTCRCPIGYDGKVAVWNRWNAA